MLQTRGACDRINSSDLNSSFSYSHPTSGCSAAEIMAALFFSEMRYDPNNPRDANADRFVLSKVSEYFLIEKLNV